jgi:hypothetical protein
MLTAAIKKIQMKTAKLEQDKKRLAAKIANAGAVATSPAAASKRKKSR